MLFSNIVFGPIKSRRLGKSLGINLLSADEKICNFNCVYCECGWTNLKSNKKGFIDKNIIFEVLQKKFNECYWKKTEIDTITFAGNGEPTMHPQFEEIVDIVITLRNHYLPKCKIAVLSNSSLIGNRSVLASLHKIDLRIMKLDAGTNEMFRLIDQPLSNKDIHWYINKLMGFKGDLLIQTIFLKGTINGAYFDNSVDTEVDSWIEHLKKINPKSVMLYTIQRDTPLSTLVPLKKEEMELIKNKLKQNNIISDVYY